MSSYYYRDPAAPEPNQPRRVTVVAIIEHEGNVLFDRRADAPYWGLIGGHLEDDESLAEGLRREIHEETGLAVTSFSLFGTFSDASRRVRYANGDVYPLVTVAYRVKVDDTSKLRQSDESRGFRFFSPDEFPPDVIATQRPVIDRYLSGEPPPFLD
jgi:ADP-ribose pyrophosphatase YjhB (NUDIX family)